MKTLTKLESMAKFRGLVEDRLLLGWFKTQLLQVVFPNCKIENMSFSLTCGAVV